MDTYTTTVAHKPRNVNIVEATGTTYTEIAIAAWRVACLGERPTTWHFRVENGLVFARNGEGNEYLVDGVPARFILEMMEVYNETLRNVSTSLRQW